MDFDWNVSSSSEIRHSVADPLKNDLRFSGLCHAQLTLLTRVCRKVDFRLPHFEHWCDCHVSIRTAIRRIRDELTTSCSFESAIVPKWGASTITFQNVYVARRSRGPNESNDEKSNKKRVRTATGTPPAPTPFRSSSLAPEAYTIGGPPVEGENYTMFDLNLDEVEVTLSIVHWLDGKGLVKDAKVKGVRGVVGMSALKK